MRESKRTDIKKGVTAISNTFIYCKDKPLLFLMPWFAGNG